ncbi:hypothetical protein [Nonomuraea sp. LPB2021202275-12-8]|uniref:hypothetical protein n=1 Tax=Nonomuraea sp. LPB2021202275-12-8 TaxID=3120159 RepID=UPI00300DB9CA
MEKPLASALHQTTGPFYVLDKEVAEGLRPGTVSSWGQEVSPPGDDWLAVGANSVLFQAGLRKRSYVRLDVWNGPPPTGEAWQRTWDGRLLLPSGVVTLVEFEEGELDDYAPLDLGVREALWQVRVRARFLTSDREVGLPAEAYDVDLYGMQLWRLAGE